MFQSKPSEKIKTSNSRIVTWRTVLLITPFFLLFNTSCVDQSDVTSDPKPDVVVEWNEFVMSAGEETDQFQTLLTHRAIPLMHLAVHDAINSIVPVYEPYAYSVSNPEADPIVAASQAAHDVVVEIFPDYSESAAELHQQWIKNASDSDAREKGKKAGKESAQAILDIREGDGYDSVGEFIPVDEPGSYRITPPFDEPIGTGWPDTEPLSMSSPDQFRPGPPPSLDSEVYAQEFDEVKRMGQKDSEERTDDQTQIGYWFAEYPTVSYPEFARTRLLEDDIHLWSAARLLALLAIDNFDGLISVFDAKYTYGYWRPYTAIRNADQDGNPATEPDPDWIPEMTTAPHPDYPAALATLCAGGVVVLKEFFGTSDILFKREAGTVPEGMPNERSYISLDSMVKDCENSRVYNGFHFRTGLNVGSEMGRERAQYLLENHLTKQPGTEYPSFADY